jgi:hypothetical protein
MSGGSAQTAMSWMLESVVVAKRARRESSMMRIERSIARLHRELVAIRHSSKVKFSDDTGGPFVVFVVRHKINAAFATLQLELSSDLAGRDYNRVHIAIDRLRVEVVDLVRRLEPRTEEADAARGHRG